MANTQASNSVYVRGAVQTVAALAVVAGGVSWVAGWEYGHLLTTIGLATLLIAIWPPNFSMHRAIAAEYVRLSARSTGEESEAHLQSAVHQLRKLAAKRPGAAWRLAATLDQLWQLLADAERYDDALPIAREAVQNWRPAADDRRSYRDNLSRSLNHVAVNLGRLDRRAEAIPSTEESISIRRSLIAEHEEQLVLDLSNLAIALRDGDRWEDALPVNEEAAAICRRLVPANEERLTRAARVAADLAATFAQLGRSADSLEAAQEWVGYERALAAEHRDRRPQLAEAVRMLGVFAMTAGHSDVGMSWWRESIAIRRQLAEESDEHLPAYAEACNAIGHGLGTVGEAAESLALFRDGLAVRRALVAEDPAHTDDLVTELARAAVTTRYYSTDADAAAAEFAAEAVTVARASTSPAVLLKARESLREVGYTDEASELFNYRPWG